MKFQHPTTNEELTGTEKERDQKMAQWWTEIAANSGASGSNVTVNPPASTPMTPITTPFDGTSGMPGAPVPAAYGFPPPPGYFYPPPVGALPSTMPTANIPVQPGQSP